MLLVLKHQVSQVFPWYLVTSPPFPPPLVRTWALGGHGEEGLAPLARPRVVDGADNDVVLCPGGQARQGVLGGVLTPGDVNRNRRLVWPLIKKPAINIDHLQGCSDEHKSCRWKVEQ